VWVDCNGNWWIAGRSLRRVKWRREERKEKRTKNKK
jgi:hypothetical protein